MQRMAATTGFESANTAFALSSQDSSAKTSIPGHCAKCTERVSWRSYVVTEIRGNTDPRRAVNLKIVEIS